MQGAIFLVARNIMVPPIQFTKTRLSIKSVIEANRFK